MNTMKEWREKREEEENKREKHRKSNHRSRMKIRRCTRNIKRRGEEEYEVKKTRKILETEINIKWKRWK